MLLRLLHPKQAGWPLPYAPIQNLSVLPWSLDPSTLCLYFQYSGVLLQQTAQTMLAFIVLLLIQ